MYRIGMGDTYATATGSSQGPTAEQLAAFNAIQCPAGFVLPGTSDVNWNASSTFAPGNLCHNATGYTPDNMAQIAFERTPGQMIPKLLALPTTWIIGAGLLLFLTGGSTTTTIVGLAIAGAGVGLLGLSGIS